METADRRLHNGCRDIMNRSLKHGFYLVFLSCSCIFPQSEQLFSII